MRLTVTQIEYDLLQTILKEFIQSTTRVDLEAKALLLKLERQQRASLVIKVSKQKATKKAVEAKVSLAKDKITNAVNILNFENKKININSVAKLSTCSYNTVKKYSYLLVSY